MNEFVKTRNTRTDDARKIDEWSAKLPGGKRVTFDVLLKYVETTAVFSLRSAHPQFADIGKLIAPDLNDLKSQLDNTIADVVRRDAANTWRPADKVSIRHDKKTDDYGRTRFSLSFNIEPVDVNIQERVGNRGETLVRDEYKQEIIVQRSHEDDFSDVVSPKGGLTSPEAIAFFQSPLRNEPDQKVTRSVIQDGRDAVADVVGMIEEFSAALAARMGPGEVAQRGVPTREEIAAMMTSCAEKVAAPDDDFSM